MKVSPIRLIHTANNELVAVDFGHGGRAEHEEGIQKFKEVLAVHTESDGLNKCVLNVFPKDNYIFEKLEYGGQFYFVFYFSTDEIHSTSRKKRDLKYWIEEIFNLKYSQNCRHGINAAWSDSEFLIAASLIT